jgi:phosphoserine phosphatase RsbU/P
MVQPVDIDRDSEHTLREYVQGLENLLEATQKLAAEKSLDRLLRLIIERACCALGCERASLFLYDEQRRELYTGSVTELDACVAEIRFSIDAGIAGRVARQRRVELVTDPYGHPDFNPAFDQRSGFRTRSILAAPLISWIEGERLLGVLELLNKRSGSFQARDQGLLSAFAAHAAIALNRALLMEHYEEKARLLVSLDLARQIQRGFFPRQLPDVPGYEIAGMSQPADQTGGDYYDVLPLDNGQLGLVVADVSGHGFGPSLLMATVRAVLRGIARHEPAPDVVASELSRVLFDELQHVRRFVTLLYGTLDAQQHCFRYANAGHGPVALHLDAATGVVHSLVYDDARGFPLGLVEQTLGTCAPVELRPGDLLLLGTDGLVEARRAGQQFGLQRLCALALERRSQPLGKLIEGLFQEVIAFQDAATLEDDLTLLIVRRR